jgi:HlyD family secretion protein
MSRGDVAKANASLRFANTEMTRYRELAKVGAVPQLLSQEKTANFLIMTSELRQARYGVAQQQAKLLVERARLFQQRNGLQSQLAEQERQTLGLSRELADVKRILANTAVRAPMAATVVRTTLNHVGQVVNAGEVIAELAPTHAPLLVKALVPAKDVAAVRPQQKTYLRVGACPYSRFGLLTGRIKQVAPDTMAAPAGAAAASGGGPFYEVTIQPDRRELGKGQERCALRIGMDLQADVMTKRTTIMGFLFSKLRLMAQS